LETQAYFVLPSGADGLSERFGWPNMGPSGFPAATKSKGDLTDQLQVVPPANDFPTIHPADLVLGQRRLAV